MLKLTDQLVSQTSDVEVFGLDGPLEVFVELQQLTVHLGHLGENGLLR